MDLAAPPPGFDPLTASPEALRDYGLPQPPDSERTPALHRAWLRLFKRPWVFVESQPRRLQEGREFVELEVAPSSTQQPLLTGSTRIETSDNWAGAMIAARGGRQFTIAFGEWTVPAPTQPPPEDRGPAGVETIYTCSAWLGLDGARQYLDSSLPQIGTTQSLAVAADGTQTVTCNAFFQWWAARQISVHYETLPGITLQPGDRVMALLTVVDPRTVVAVFRKFGPQSQIAVIQRTAPDVRLGDGTVTQPRIAGATAEWIVERPRPFVNDSPNLDRFPDYRRVDFSSCVAGLAAQPGAATAEATLAAARLLRMYEVPQNAPSRTRFISVPHRETAEAVAVTYGWL